MGTETVPQPQPSLQIRYLSFGLSGTVAGFLWQPIRWRVDEIAGQSPEETLREWIGLITRQEGRRLDAVMARLGHTDEKILLREAVDELGVSYARVQQIVQQAIQAVDKHGLPGVARHL